MSSRQLCVTDESGGGGEGGKVVSETQEEEESEEVRECVQNGAMSAEEDESDRELDGEEEVLYDTTSHETLESSTGSGESDMTWEDRYDITSPCVVAYSTE